MERKLKQLRAEWFIELEQDLRRGDIGGKIAARLTELWDELLQDHFSASLGEWSVRCALFAIGGYGRREMAPFSDVDIMIMVPDEAEPGLLGAIEVFIKALWDAGIDLGHSVRTETQCDTMITTDTSVVTSLLDARQIAGSPEQHADPAERCRELTRDRGLGAFVDLIQEGVRQRGDRFGGGAYLLEPQVKLGRGGLRDLHAIDWVAWLLHGTRQLPELVERGHVGADEAESLEAARSFLLRTRFALHIHHGWKQDRLTYAAQGPVAALMGFGEEHGDESLTRFMKALHVHAREVEVISDLWLEEWTADKDEDELGTAALYDSFVADPSEVFRLLAKAQKSGRGLSPAARRAIANSTPLLPTATALSAEANRVVCDIICDIEDPGKLLRTIADSGILAVVVPEWLHLTGLAQHDTYHVYTTDVHLLMTCQQMKRLLAGLSEDRTSYLSRVASDYGRKHRGALLLLASLFHDIGKGIPGDHSIVGAGLAAEVARRMGLSSEECDHVRRLVAEHLTVVKVSQRRDLQALSTYENVARTVGTKMMLDGLALISFADMDSVGPGHLNEWKLQLLEEFHRGCTHYMKQRPSDSSDTVREAKSRIETALESEMEPELITRLLGRLSSRFLASTLLDQQLRCLRLLAGNEFGPSVAFHDAEDRSFTEVLVLEAVHPGLLAELTGILNATGLDIRNARVSPLNGRGTLDLFEVCTSDANHPAIPERRRSSISAALIRVLSGQGSFTELLRTKLRQSRLPPRGRPDVKPKVAVDNHYDPTFTIIEVKALDHPGLLAHIARGLTELELYVYRSIITTEGDRAIDTFYVADETGAKLDDGRVATVQNSMTSWLLTSPME